MQIALQNYLDSKERKRWHKCDAQNAASGLTREKKIYVDDEDTICMGCLEDKIWMRHDTEEIAESLGYEITKYKKIERPVQPAPIPVIRGKACMF